MILFVAGDQWLDVTPGSSTLETHGSRAAFAAVDGPACVVWHAARGMSGVVALEGNPRHARALIERQLRAEGSIEGETKVFIHQLRPIGQGYQALYTAAPLDEWQQLLDWAGRQAHHVLLFSTVGLLAPGHASDEAIGAVLQVGAQLMFVGRLGGRMVHLHTVGFSESPDDLALAAADLGGRLHAELQRLMPAGLAGRLHVDWYEADSASAASGGSFGKVDSDGDGDGDGVLGTSRLSVVSDHPLSSSSGVPVLPDGLALQAGDARSGEVDTAAAPAAAAAPLVAPGLPGSHEGLVQPLAPHDAFASAARVAVRVSGDFRPGESPEGHGLDPGRAAASSPVQGIAALARRARASEALNESADRWAFIADACLPLCAVIALLIAVGLTGVSVGWLLDARKSTAEVAMLHAQAQATRNRAQALQGADMSADAQAALNGQLDFIDTLERLETGHDVAGLLRAVKTSAGQDLRILGIRSDDSVAAAPGMPAVRGHGAQDGRTLQEPNASGTGPAKGAGHPPAMRADAEPADGAAAVRSVIVDGMLPDGATAQASKSLSAFVRGLRQQGYRAEPIDTRGAASLNTSSQLVSYRLTRMAAEPQSEPARPTEREVPVSVPAPTSVPRGVVDAVGGRP